MVEVARVVDGGGAVKYGAVDAVRMVSNFRRGVPVGRVPKTIRPGGCVGAAFKKGDVVVVGSGPVCEIRGYRLYVWS